MQATATAAFTKTATDTHSHGLLDSLFGWMARMVEDSPRARAADRFAQLNKLSDAELGQLGLTRSNLLTHCFGFNGHV